MKYNVDEVIGMAWSDKVSFEEIKKKTGLMEKEVISINKLLINIVSSHRC